MTTVGFIGTGVMGNAMAGHLLDQGFSVIVSNRTPSRCDNLLVRGAQFVATPAEMTALAPDFIITMVGFPTDVEAVYFGDEGLIATADPKTVLIDMTTSSPELAERIFAAAAERGIRAMDAPVSGGDLGAKNGTLTIMVGGDEAVFDLAVPVFEAFGKTITLHGDAGKGQHCKMANQINIAATMLGMAESLAYAKAAGLDPEKVIATLSGGSAQTWSLANYGPRVLREDFAPGFYVKHFVKDLKIAVGEGKAAGLELPETELALKLYEELISKGYENDGTQAISRLFMPSQDS